MVFDGSLAWAYRAVSVPVGVCVARCTVVVGAAWQLGGSPPSSSAGYKLVPALE